MMSNAGEPVLVCPYNKAHSIIQSRMQFHLAKCRVQYPHSEKVPCPYNSTHIVAKVELEFHQQTCANRYVLDSFLYDVGSSNCPVETVPLNVSPEKLAPCEENWDEAPIVSVLEGVKESAKEKNVLLNLIGAPKAERKAHRQQERLRYQRITDSKEKEESKKKNGNSYKNEETKKDQSSQLVIPEKVVEEEKPITTSSPANVDKKDKSSSEDDKFEVVKYHNKNKSKKNKTNNQPRVLPPPQNFLADNDKIMSQLTKLKFNPKENGGNESEPTPPSPSERKERFTSEINLNKNAWEKPLNMGVRANNISHNSPLRPIDDFPSLPVSGRGRALFLP